MARAMIALISGSSRGIGLETSRQLGAKGYRVVITGRDGLAGKAAADKLAAEGHDVVHHPLDVTQDGSVRRIAAFLKEDPRLGHLDVLVNNAGIFPERDPRTGATLAAVETPLETVRQTWETNCFGALRLTQAVVPLMRRGGYGRIVNVSSGYGQLDRMGGGLVGYRLSKAGLNVLTRVFAAELCNEGILVNAVDPGWVRTRMGGSQAPRDVAVAAEDIVWAATLNDDGPTGRLFHDRRPLPW